MSTFGWGSVTVPSWVRSHRDFHGSIGMPRSSTSTGLQVPGADPEPAWGAVDELDVGDLTWEFPDLMLPPSPAWATAESVERPTMPDVSPPKTLVPQQQDDEVSRAAACNLQK